MTVGRDEASMDLWAGDTDVVSRITWFGKTKLKCMEFLDKANTGAFDQSVQASVNTGIRKDLLSLFHFMTLNICISSGSDK